VSTAPPPEVQHLAPGDTRTSAPLDSWGARTYHGILNALGGAHDVTYSIDPATGKMVQHVADSGPGTQWKRIISGALTGYAAGAGLTGPGSTAAKFGAGIKAGRQQGQQQEQQGKQEATEDYQRQQDLAMNNLRRSFLAQQVAELSFKNQRAQVDASVADMERENQARALIAQGGPGSEEMGVFKTPEEARAAFQKDPTLHDTHAQGQLFVMPHVVDGKVQGVWAAKVSPDFMHSKNSEEVPISYERWDPQQKKNVTDTFTIPANGETMDRILQMKMGLATESLANHYKQMEADAKAEELKFEGQRLGLEIGKTALEKQKMQAEIQNLNLANSDVQIKSNAQQIYEGTMDPSNLNKRGKAFERTLYEVNQLSRAETGKDFDLAKASADYTQANKGNTRQTLDYVNSLTGPDNKSGNLQTLINASDKIKRTQFPALNNVEAWSRLQAGDPDMAGYLTDITEVADQVAKILQGGGSGGGTSDKKLEQAQELFSKGFNGDQIQKVATELRDLLGNRKAAMIGNNRYLQRWYGPNSVYAQQAEAGGGAGGGTAPPTQAMGVAAPRAIPPGARPGTDAKGNVVGYADAQGNWHQF
jgi:hypothetical protein